MSTNMPEAVEIFMETMNTAETEKLDSCLASEAVLFDPGENNEISGIMPSRPLLQIQRKNLIFAQLLLMQFLLLRAQKS